jgi:RNA-binding motif protein, X-linked 2
MNTIRNTIQINEEELQRGIAGTSASWHAKYEKSAWIYVGNLDHTLTEGDVICVLSQYGEIDDLHLVRDDSNGKSRGFAFCKYIDARSCILAVDNFCGIQVRFRWNGRGESRFVPVRFSIPICIIFSFSYFYAKPTKQVCGRSIRVDHVENYRLPKHLLEKEEQLDLINASSGHAYHGQELASQFTLQHGQDLFAPPPIQTKKTASSVPTMEENDDDSARRRERKRHRKEENQQKRSRNEMRKLEGKERSRKGHKKHKR